MYILDVKLLYLLIQRPKACCLENKRSKNDKATWGHVCVWINAVFVIIKMLGCFHEKCMNICTIKILLGRFLMRRSHNQHYFKEGLINSFSLYIWSDWCSSVSPLGNTQLFKFQHYVWIKTVHVAIGYDLCLRI